VTGAADNTAVPTPEWRPGALITPETDKQVEDYGFKKYEDKVVCCGTVIGLDNGWPLVALDQCEYQEDTREYRRDDPPEDIPDETFTPDISYPNPQISDRVTVTFMYSETVPGRAFAVEIDPIE